MYHRFMLANVGGFSLPLDPGSALLLFVRGARMSGAAPDSGRTSSRTVPYYVEKAVTDVFRYVSSMLFSATAKDELSDLIDATLEDDTFHILIAAAGTAAKKARLLDESEREDDLTRSAFTFVAPHNQARLLLALSLTHWAELARNSPPIADGADTNAKRNDGDGASDKGDKSPAEAALSFMTNPHYPVELKQACLGHERARVCTLGVLASYYHATSPLIMDALIDEWIRGEKDYLRTLCSITKIDIPDDVIPLNDRIDPSRVIGQRRAAEEGYQAALRGARNSGLDVFPMMGHVDE